MATCGDDIVRLVMKQSTVSGTKPTVPPTNDHKLGGWSETDIYPGELFYNVADGIMWTRATIDGTDQILTIDGFVDTYEAVLDQSSNNAPLPHNARGSLVNLTFSYISTGTFRGTLSGRFPEYRTIILLSESGTATQKFTGVWYDADTFELKSYAAGVLTDNIMRSLGIRILILPAQTPAS